jgi:hypothetical protein
LRVAEWYSAAKIIAPPLNRCSILLEAFDQSALCLSAPVGFVDTDGRGDARDGGPRESNDHDPRRPPPRTAMW